MKPAFSCRRKAKIEVIDFICLMLSYLIIAQLLIIGVTIHVKFSPLSKVDVTIASFNRVIYLLRGRGGNLSDALTAEQVVARYQAAENDRCTLTIHSILTTPPAALFLPSSTATKASQSFWQIESAALHTG